MSEAKKSDPLAYFATYLKEVNVLTDEREKQMLDDIMNIVNDATDYAENAPYAEAESALKYVYGE